MKNHIIFDLDGTIADTQKIHQQIESDFLKEKGLFIDPKEIGVRFAGRTPQEWISEVLLLNKINFHKEELELFVSKKDEIVISMLNEGKIELMPYAFEILELLHQNDYKIGISSGACREFIDQFIVYFNLKEIVVASTSSNEVEKKKPNPDVFLTSFKKIEDLFGIPDNKLVIGDGWSDVEGGHKSGAKTIWLNYSKKDKINESYCDFEIESLKDLKDILGFNN